jgi:hypothetical protein
LVIYTDTLPITKKRESVEHALKEHLSEKITDRKVEIYHHDSRSNFMLQVVDYVGWAIYIKHERNELRPYEVIQNCIKTDISLFKVFYEETSA